MTVNQSLKIPNISLPTKYQQFLLLSVNESPKTPVLSVRQSLKFSYYICLLIHKIPVISIYKSLQSLINFVSQSTKNHVLSVYQSPKIPAIFVYQSTKIHVISVFQSTKIPVMSVFHQRKFPLCLSTNHKKFPLYLSPNDRIPVISPT